MKTFQIILIAIFCCSLTICSADIHTEPQTSWIKESGYENYIKCLGTDMAGKFSSLALEAVTSTITPLEFVKGVASINFSSDRLLCLNKLVAKKLNIPEKIFTKLGYTLLYSVNCFKDVGPALIFLDSVIDAIGNRNVSEIFKNSLIEAIIAYQSVGDCQSAFDNILSVWNYSK